MVEGVGDNFFAGFGNARTGDGSSRAARIPSTLRLVLTKQDNPGHFSIFADSMEQHYGAVKVASQN